MVIPSPLRPWYWQDFEKFYPYYQGALIGALTVTSKATVCRVTDLFRGALGLVCHPILFSIVLTAQHNRYNRCVGLCDQAAPPSSVFEEREKLLVKKSDKAKPGFIPCYSGLQPFDSGIFICAPGNALIDHRFACPAATPPVPGRHPAAFFIQTKHTSMTDTTVSAAEIKLWYTETMAALTEYTNNYFVVLVFVTNREFKGNAYHDLFSKGCPNLLLLVNDVYRLSRSLATFLGPIFAHRAMYAPDKPENTDL